MAGDIDGLVRRMQTDLASLEGEGDARRFFHATYLRTTRAVAEEVARGGFLDAAWVERWDVAFAELYLDALQADREGGRVPGPWRVAFDAARESPELPPLRHVLLGMNAHINLDLAQSLVTVISDEEFSDPAVVTRRGEDHRHVDEVLSERVGAEDAELRAGNRLLAPANRFATRRFLRESRAKVWANARQLSRARVEGEKALAARRVELERLSTARVADLVGGGPVLLKLGLRGFGVLLQGAREDAARSG